MEQAVRKIALLGMGTVGGGVYEIIERQKEEMPFKIGAALEVVKVLVRNKAKYADRIPAEKLTDVWEDVIGDDSIDIVVEVMGGIEPARTYIKAALEKGIPGRTVRDAKRELGDALKSKIVEGHKKVFWME